MGKWLLGIIILAIAALGLSYIGPWNAIDRSDNMQKSIQMAVAEAGHEFAVVGMDGHVASISGAAPSQEAMDAVMAIAKGTDCEDCKDTDGVWHKAINKMTVAEAPKIPTVVPYTFSISKTDAGVSMEGVVRNDNELRRVKSEASDLFGETLISHDISVAMGQPNENWGDAISKYMKELAGLDTGRVLINDAQALITGKTNDEAIRARINALSTNPIEGFAEAVNISVPDTAASIAGSVQSQALCQSLMNEIKGREKVVFASNQAEIKPDSLKLLDNLASAARQCPDFNLRIEGHTDSDGVDSYNQDLSERRARAVSAYLARQGIDTMRMRAEGLGEARPIADNDTPEGKAANRRIEFIITKSE